MKFGVYTYLRMVNVNIARNSHIDRPQVTTKSHKNPIKPQKATNSDKATREIFYAFKIASLCFCGYLCSLLF